MTRSFAFLVMLGLILGAATEVKAGPVLGFDENGNGAFGPGALAPDPGPGGLPAVLTYHLPFAGVPGDVALLDNGVTLDVIRFNGNGTLLFYSDNVGGADAIGDTASPPAAFYANLVRLEEVGPEGNNGALYTPGPNDPGFDPSGPTYNLVSDGTVPEPGTCTLLGMGIAGLFAYGRRRKCQGAV